ncbi:4Fe-4S binding protein [bacterium]|nr:4Fe-4S binding protein [bacterium]
MSLSQNAYRDMSLSMKAGLGVFGFGLLMLFVSLTGASNDSPALFFFLSFGLSVIGGLIYIVPQIKKYRAGIRNNHIFFSSVMSRGASAWIIGILFTGFYIVLYWFPELISNWIRLVDPLSLILRGKSADQWFLYGTFYTLAVLVMGTRMIVKYRHSRYQILRTSSVMFFQLGFAFIIPSLLEMLNQPGFYFTYFWPLRPYSLWPSDFQNLLAHPGGLGIFMIFWGIIMTFVATPVLTYFFGKRWYCSWVCGCGGLAETLGDPFRQLSDKSLKAWKIERILIHSVLVFVTVTTSLLWLNSYFGGTILGNLSGNFASWYGFLIGSVFSGVIGTGFYPIMGSRVWCRFGCPMAAILGIIQKYFSRFRITTNGGQCISCGNCSTYCEMGIDVRAYAQRGENIVRASCVGCGVCSAVCPRGVLNLENGPSEKRYHLP